MVEAVNQGTLTYDQLLQTLDESLFANLDVTIGGLSWNPVFLAASPDSQERLRQEVLSNGRSLEASEAHLLSSNTYLAACVLESARLRPLAAFSVPQSAPTQRTVGGYVIPACTNFIIDSYALNVRGEHWGADSQSFRPERFLEPQNSRTKIRYHYWRFGFGPRQCMGKYVVDVIIRTVLAYMVSHYRLSLIDSKAEWQRNAESWITHPDFSLRCEKLVEREEEKL